MIMKRRYAFSSTSFRIRVIFISKLEKLNILHIGGSIIKDRRNLEIFIIHIPNIKRYSIVRTV